MPICSIGILTLLAGLFGKKIWTGNLGPGKLRHRPRPRGGVGMLVRMIA